MPPPPAPPMTLTGVRRAILRSLYVAVFTASITALVMCVLPGHATLDPTAQPQLASAGNLVQRAQVEPAGGPLLALAMIASAGLAAIGLAMPRREINVLAAGTLTILAVPIVFGIVLSSLDYTSEVATETLWPAHVLQLALPVVAGAGPLLAVLGFILFRFEARAGAPPIPLATLR